LNWYNDATFILSTSHYESSGAAVCEGMACGCIPIITNIPSFRTMTKQGEIGLLFEPGDVHGLYHSLVKSRTLNVCSQRAEVLAHFQENLSCDAVSKKTFKVISSL
jgi:glycosyltransferase involved in cell wall biosynthesis